MGWMGDEVFDALCQQIEPLVENIQFVQFGVHGEPMLDKKLEERVGRLSAMGLKVWIATNAAAMVPKRGEKLLEAGVDQIFFAVDGATKETYEKVRLGLSFEKVIANIEAFLGQRNAGGYKSRAVIRIIEQNTNSHELVDWTTKWQKEITEGLDSLQVVKMHNWANRLGSVGSYGTTPCNDLIRNVIISADGSIPLCCLDHNSKQPFGNILETPLIEILGGEARTKLVELHAAGRRNEIDKCKTCYLPEESYHSEELDVYSSAVKEEDLHWN